jgi:hypothetical protein
MDSLPARNPCIIPARMLAITPTRIPTADAVTMESHVLSLMVSASWKTRIFIRSKNTAIAVTKPYSGSQKREIRTTKRSPIRRVKDVERLRDASFLIMSYTYTVSYGMPLFIFNYVLPWTPTVRPEIPSDLPKTTAKKATSSMSARLCGIYLKRREVSTTRQLRQKRCWLVVLLLGYRQVLNSL